MIYQIQGVSFLILGTVALLLPRQQLTLKWLARNLWLLGLFALIHGLAVFANWHGIQGVSASVALGYSVLLPLSYLALLEFARRAVADQGLVDGRTSLALYPLLLLPAAFLMLGQGMDGATVESASRLLLGFPAASLVTVAFLGGALMIRDIDLRRHARNWLLLAAGGTAVYAVVLPVVSIPASGLLSGLPVESTVSEGVGVPVRLIRAIAILAITGALFGLVRALNNLGNRELTRVLDTVRGYVYRVRNDKDWSAIYIAGDIESLHGLPASEFLEGRAKLDDLVHPDDKPWVWKTVQQGLAREGRYELVCRALGPTGEMRWIHDRGRGIYDSSGQLKYLEGHMVDATALQQARGEVDQFKRSLDQVLDGVLIVDPDDLRLTYTNEGASHQTGRDAATLHGMPLFDLLADQTEADLRRLIQPLLDGSDEALRFQTELDRRDGGRTPVEVFLQYLGRAEGTPRFVAIVHEISARLAAEKALKQANNRLEQAEWVAALGHWELDPASGVMIWSEELRRLLDLTEPATIERFRAAFHPDDQRLLDEAFARCRDAGPKETLTLRGRPKNQSQQYFSLITRHVGGNDELSLVGTLQDVTEREQVLAELREAERRERRLRDLAEREQSRMAALLSGMSIGILFEDSRGRVEYVNPAFRNMWAVAETVNLVGKPTSDVLAHSTHEFARPDHASRYALQVLDTHEISERFELDLHDGRILTQLSYPVHGREGQVIGRLWIYEDVTHERQTAKQLVYLAEHDPLTGLANRHRFQEHLERTIHTSGRLEQRFALLYFDLDDFKHINDNFGHRAGDTVLVRTAGEISALVRGGDLLARLGGDEFAILTGLGRGDLPRELAERIIHAVSSVPLRFRGSNYRLTVSVGIAVFPDHGRDPETLVAHADVAMYQAKKQGKNTWAVYDASQDQAQADLQRLSWGRRVALALERNLLELHYQGVYRVRDRRLSHLETLVRMQDPKDPARLLMPGQFIPVAEKTGQILEIDRWVLRQSIQTLSRHADLRGLAVNLSARSLDDTTLPHYIQSLLLEHGVEAGRLLIELTETAAVSEMQDAQNFIEALQRTGCRVCLDDFGSGFATFAYLKYLAVDVLKIDGMFIRDLPNNRDNQAFVKAMIDVASGLQKTIIAECVEDEATLQLLDEMGVSHAQGFFLDRPAAHHASLGDTRRAPD
ncbi:EAL domain-containing protein [Methylonatrum kenyense]|uniref:PAS domain-containing protein n=1 Tax=Methylonatrum kenyense TaxID=455253 RepID=UPI0020BEE1B9|nr:PAS domain-containing protein [Methylonatrum kenyense]MCK8515199.1 EAL domain-containing protein [Methylonatrum kenyense]